MEFLLKSGSCVRNLGYLGTQTLQEIKSTNKNLGLEGCMEKLPEGNGKRADLERKEREQQENMGQEGEWKPEVERLAGFREESRKKTLLKQPSESRTWLRARKCRKQRLVF